MPVSSAVPARGPTPLLPRPCCPHGPQRGAPHLRSPRGPSQHRTGTEPPVGGRPGHMTKRPTKHGSFPLMRPPGQMEKPSRTATRAAPSLT